MLRQDHQESIPQDIYLLSRLSGKVGPFGVHVDRVLNSLKGHTCYHSGQRPLPLSSLSDPQSNVSSHRTRQRSGCKIVSCQNILNRQDQTRPMGNLRARKAFEGFGCRNHSQRRIAGSNTGENALCCPVFLSKQPHNA